ncbi:aminopeptidase N-like isoform X2 [Photinus pyralis]|uniref:Aminopeptidase n=1 Tax=Photinus pyralis TaxID=7054 RepID=A0A1Y1KK93_PHOPY|nr:aminopeptidase N-like isoform X2 [Photinus pyralis]
MVGRYTEGVPTTAELESNGNKYTVNRRKSNGVTLSKLTLALMALAAALLIALAVGLTILLYPHCTNAAPEALLDTKSKEIAERLPTNLSPTHYRLQLIPFLHEQNFTSSGAVTITFKVNEETDKIVINAYDMQILKDSVKVRELNGTESISVKDQRFNNVSESYTIDLSENLLKDKEYDVEMKFIGQLRDNMQGFYRSQYLDSKTNTIKRMASTQFSPTDARRAFPCFDEPAFKAKFTISIGRPSNMSSLSNMPKRTTDTMIERENWEWDHYAETPTMSTFIVAFIVSDLQAYRYNNPSGTQFTVHTRLRTADQIKLAIELSPKILDYYENYFKIKFPLPKIDLVAVPDFGFNAMENWGLITFRETALLFDENTATVEDKKHIVGVLAHELVHQWFGNLVTPAWWNDLWLKEGFANYLRYLSIHQVQPSWKIGDEFLLDETYQAFKFDYFKSSRPITLNVVNVDNIRQMFDSISYSKGASVIRMVSKIIGEDNFKQGMIRYLNQYQFSNGNHDNLWDSLTAQTENIKLESSLKNIMDTWILQAGFPVVTAVRNSTTGTVHLSQKRFLLSKENASDALWWIPISYASDTNPQLDDTSPKFWLKNEPEASVTINANHWWLLNLQQTGYYIVNYDEHNWRKLVENVMIFPLETRVQLISDSMDLARANLLDYDIPLRMLTNLAIQDKDISFITHQAALNKVSYLYSMLINSPIHKKFQNFIFRIFDNALTNVDFNDQPHDEYLVQRIRKLIVEWACKKSESMCTNNAQKLFRKWIENPVQNKIRPNIQKVVLCTSVREGGELEWELVYKHFMKTDSVFEKNILLEALGCSQKPWILNRYLDLIMQNNTAIRKQDSPQVFKAVANNPVGSSLAFSYIRSNWDQLNQHFGSAFSIISKMVAELPTYMNTEYQLIELKNFKKNNQNHLGTSSQAWDRVIETVQSNVEWMGHSYKSIEKWLSDQAHYYGLQNTMVDSTGKAEL